MRYILAIAYEFKMPLFKMVPHLFPYDFMCPRELALWGEFYEEMNNKRS